MTHKHAITHIELSTRNLEETKEFYTSVFEWDIKDYPEMNYSTFNAEGGTGGGFNPITDEYPEGTVMIYINTPNLTETLEKVKAAGGTIIMDGYDIPTVGRMATFKDPTGNVISLLQPLKK